MSKQWAIITGGGTGIGSELAIKLAAKGMQVLICGRRQAVLDEVCSHNPQQILSCEADIGDEQDRQKIIAQLPADADIRFIVQHAATLNPITPIEEIKLEDWRQTFAINVEGPLFLLQSLLPRLTQCRVLHLSSNQAHKAQVRMAAYGASKAALFSLYKNLNAELNERGIHVASVQPGIVKTPSMYAVWERKLGDQIDQLGQIIQDTYGHKLYTPDEVADYLIYMLFDKSNEAFIQQEWDIRDDKDYLALNNLTE